MGGGWAQSLHCRLLPWDLVRKKMGFLPPEHVPLERHGRGFAQVVCLGDHSRGNPQEELMDCSSITQHPSQSQQSCGLVTSDLSQPPNISLSTE